MRNWSDQPEISVEAESLLNIYLGSISSGILVGVIKGKNPRYFLTVGNLFGSQTVELYSADDTFKMIQKLSEVKGVEKVKIRGIKYTVLDNKIEKECLV